MKRSSVEVSVTLKKLVHWRLAVASALLVGFGGCTAARHPLTTDKSTNWMTTCKVTSECGSGLICIHGICTSPCSTADACAELAQDAICATLRTNLCSPQSGQTAGFCTLGCGERACAGAAEGLACVESACVPRSCAGDAGIPMKTPVDAGGRGATVRDATPAATVRDASRGATSRDATPAARSCSSPGWHTVHAMKQLRMAHTATRLDDDTVLVAGGVIGTGPIAEAEIYDPVKDTWTVVGTLHEPRGGHEAVLLDNHKVLVVGGLGTNGTTFPPLASPELYDPGTNTWTPTGGLTSAHSGTATKLGDGRVLFAAGDTNAGASARSEIYDPTTGLWSITGNLNQARSGHTATLLGDKKTVLVAGGSSTGNDALTSAETYDPSTGKWTTVGSLEEPRLLTRATLLQNGKVLVTAGSTPAANAASASAELYDPDSKTWSKATSMGEPRYYHTSTLLRDGTVLVAGGTSGLSGNMLPAVTTAEIYDASVDKWTSAGTLVPAVSEHAATLLNDGSVLITGGFDGSFAINGAQVYCPP